VAFRGQKRPARPVRRAARLQAAAGRFRTKQELVYRTLRDAIQSCRLAPGDRLLIDDLARRLEVSAIPVREALQMLQSEGLVVNVPHVGATVAPLSRESVREVFAVMEGLETVGARAAAERLTADDLAQLEELVAAMDAALATGRAERWSALNSQFHLAISRMARMPVLLEMTERILGRWDRLRRFYFKGVLSHRMRRAQREHRALLAAFRGRDLERLDGLLRAHIRGAHDDYTAFLERQGDRP
jgi:DNA-binding GntR family transcriptional regulator